jgi:hypothetical protein
MYGQPIIKICNTGSNSGFSQYDKITVPQLSIMALILVLVYEI